MMMPGMFTVVLICSAFSLAAQDRARYQTDFPLEEFAARRAKVFDAIGPQAMAVVQGAPAVDGFKNFRQTNEFYYLCGLETPHALILLDGRSRRTTLYLPHRDEGRERGEGKVLSAEDAELVRTLTGVDAVHPVEMFARQQVGTVLRPPPPVLYVPFSPAEGMAQSRDELLVHRSGVSSDPWDGRTPREAHFIQLLRDRFPSFELRDLSPILDTLRLIKSEREIALIRRASVLAGEALLEAMRSTRPGVFEYQLDAAANYVFRVNGAKFEGYNSITAGGTNAWMGHYFHNTDPLKAGDMVLMDYAPDYRYYTSDVTRMWPVSGTYTADQRELAMIILRYREALIKHIRPGVMPQDVLENARREMEPVIAGAKLSKEIYRKGAEGMLTFRGHLSHPVGMTVHDVGTYWRSGFKKGMVFSVDPMMWIPEEKLYIRIEDVVVVTDNGVENFTSGIAATPEEIMAVMKQEGVVQRKPALKEGR